MSVEVTRDGDEVARRPSDEEAVPATAHVCLAAIKARIVADITVRPATLPVTVDLDHFNSLETGPVSKSTRAQVDPRAEVKSAPRERGVGIRLAPRALESAPRERGVGISRVVNNAIGP